MSGMALPDDEYARRWIERVTARCTVEANGCWIWQGSTQISRNQKPDERGYGSTTYRSKTVRIHRKMLELVSGQTQQEHIQACHTCDNRPCCNPDHLYWGTNQQNHLDGGKRKRMQGQTKTHCAQGHEFTPENTYIARRPQGGGSRHCRECMRIRGRRRYWRDPKAFNERKYRNALRRQAQSAGDSQ